MPLSPHQIAFPQSRTLQSQDQLSFGWKPRFNESSISAELLSRSTFGLGRAISNGNVYTLSSRAEYIHFLYVLRGAGELRNGPDVHRLSTGSLVSLFGDDQAQIEIDPDVPRYGWYFRARRGSNLNMLQSVGQSRTIDAELAHPLVSVINAILNRDSNYSFTTLYHVSRAVEELTWALLGEVDSFRDAKQREGLLPVLRETIAHHAADAHFSVAELARVSHLSTATVYRAFGSQGTTPGQEIESERLKLAFEYFARGRLTRQQIAAAAGFGNVRRLRNAMSRGFRSSGP